MTRRSSQAELRRLYEQQRLTPAEIGERLGVSGRTIRVWLQQAGIALRPRWERRRRHLPPADTELQRCYHDEGMTTAQLAARYGVSATTAKRWLDNAGIPRRARGRSSRAPSAEELRRLYQDEGLSTTQIARRYGVVQQTAHWWLRAAQIPLRPAGRPVRADPGHLAVPQTMVGDTQHDAGAAVDMAVLPERGPVPGSVAPGSASAICSAATAAAVGPPRTSRRPPTP